MAEEQNLIQWIYASKNNQELSDRYDFWAKSYEDDLDRDFGWFGPAHAVEVFEKFVPKDARVLDAGAGTGLVGKLLADRGYQELVAMDMSPGMLKEARGKGVYQEFHQMVMGEELDFPQDSFDAVVSVGVLTLGHAPASSLDELVRVTRPGGHVIFTLRPDLYVNAGFKAKREELEAAGRWKLALTGDPVKMLPKGEPELSHQVWVFTVTA